MRDRERKKNTVEKTISLQPVFLMYISNHRFRFTIPTEDRTFQNESIPEFKIAGPQAHH